MVDIPRDYPVRNTESLFDPISDIEEFHRKFGQAYSGKPRSLVDELLSFRVKFLREELKEYTDAAYAGQIALMPNFPDIPGENIENYLAHQLDALVDLIYVALGTAHLQGFDFREAWRRVHSANMKKERAISAAQSLRGSSFDVIKPAGWEKPDHLDLVSDHAHKEQTSDKT